MNALRRIILGMLLLPAPVPAASTTDVSPPVSRRPLLTANLGATVPVATVQIKEVTMHPHVKAERHVHPCPVLGVIVRGTIAFQIEGRPPQILHAGDAFFEPADAVVVRFDNIGDEPATFVAHYLLAADDTELIRLLPQ